MKRIIAAVFFFGLSQTSLAGVYDLTFRRVATVGNEATCQAILEDVAANLASQTQVSVIDKGCVADQFSVRALDAVVTYQAASRLDITSTYTYPHSYSAAFYSSREECNEQLETQKTLFVKATGLQPLSAHCMLDVALNQRWETRVDAVGLSTVKPEASHVSVFGKVINRDQVLAAYESAADPYGISIFEAGVSSGSMGEELVLRFYSTNSLSFQYYNRMEFENAEACLTAATAVQNVLQTTSKPAVVFCVQDGGIVGTTLYATTLVDTFEPVDVFKARELANQHSTLAACNQAAERIDTISDDIYGAVCAGKRGSYQVHLFSKP